MTNHLTQVVRHDFDQNARLQIFLHKTRFVVREQPTFSKFSQALFPPLQAPTTLPIAIPSCIHPPSMTTSASTPAHPPVSQPRGGPVCPLRSPRTARRLLSLKWGMVRPLSGRMLERVTDAPFAKGRRTSTRTTFTTTPCSHRAPAARPRPQQAAPCAWIEVTRTVKTRTMSRKT